MSDPTKQETEQVFKILKGQKANKVFIFKNPDTQTLFLIAPLHP